MDDEFPPEDQKKIEIELAWSERWSPSRSNARQLRRVFLRDSGRCFYCEKQTWLKTGGKKLGPNRDMATREHLIRRCEGGPNSDDNIVLACHDCNTTRGDLSVEDHRAAIRMRITTPE